MSTPRIYGTNYEPEKEELSINFAPIDFEKSSFLFLVFVCYIFNFSGLELNLYFEPNQSKT